MKRALNNFVIGRARKLRRRLDTVSCRKQGDRWYVTYGAILRNSFTCEREAQQNAAAVREILRQHDAAMLEVQIR